ncbi:MAG: hypothetical protein ACI8RZ_003419, partial [Myxococcota bacterium]
TFQGVLRLAGVSAKSGEVGLDDSNLVPPGGAHAPDVTGLDARLLGEDREPSAKKPADTRGAA